MVARQSLQHSRHVLESHSSPDDLTGRQLDVHSQRAQDREPCHRAHGRTCEPGPTHSQIARAYWRPRLTPRAGVAQAAEWSSCAPHHPRHDQGDAARHSDPAVDCRRIRSDVAGWMAVRCIAVVRVSRVGTGAWVLDRRLARGHPGCLRCAVRHRSRDQEASAPGLPTIAPLRGCADIPRHTRSAGTMMPNERAQSILSVKRTSRRKAIGTAGNRQPRWIASARA